MLSEDLWTLEHRFWLEGAPLYRERLTTDSAMVFAGMGIMDRAAIIESIANGPRWRDVTLADRHDIRRNGLAILAYSATARREDGEPYRALCSSTYIDQNDTWMLVFHQQTAQS